MIRRLWCGCLESRARRIALGTALGGVVAPLAIWAQAAAPAPRPAGVLQTSASQQAGPVRFAFGGDAVQIPATFLGHLVFFPVNVNGSRPLLFEVNSTAVGSSIDTARASEMELVNLSAPTIHLSGVDLELPDFTRGTEENFAELVGRAYEGTLGKDFLEHFVVELDYGRQTAQLHDPAAFHYSGKGKVFPLRFAGPMPVVRAKFDVGGKTYDADFGVNTALDAPIRISPRYAGAHRILGSHPHTLPATDEPFDAKAIAVRLKSFQIGPFMIPAPMGEVAEAALPAGDTKLAGEIGGGMLRRFIVILDYTHQEMILDESSKFPDDDAEDMSGISMVAKGPGLRTFQVVSVAPGTPGADAKIQKGDVIAGIDTDPAADLTLFEVRELFRQVGHTYKLLLQRNGQDIPVTIQMRRLL
jgi:PDZ domain